MNTRPSYFTFAIVVAAVVVSVIPQAASALVYNRDAILGGQLWRLITGHFVHVSPSHLGYDLIVVGVCGWILEQQDRRQFVVLCLLSMLLIGTGLLVFEPRFLEYGGLSGVSCALVTYLALIGLREPGARRWTSAAVLLLVAAKLTWECIKSEALFYSSDNSSFVLAPSAHVIGAVSAFLTIGARAIRRVVLLQPKVTS